ncbi:MAG: class I SAM-dependent methyltransferase [Candidatus Omnitrophica bacterium]|nr:class I SAM-dependent methyltransferase [Candidatus Omnitrophota bacterium]
MMKSKEILKHFCNLCQHETPCVKLYRLKGYDIVQCADCGLVYVAFGASPIVKVADIYSQDYFEGGVSDGYVEYSSNEEVLCHQAKRIIRQIFPYQNSGTLLEIGCAYGFFLLEARKFFKVQGVEKSSFAAGQAKNRGLDVLVGDLPDLNLPKLNYSTVCLFDCIEHLTDPYGYLRHIHALLEPKGLVVLTTGDINSFYARIAGQKWRLMTPPQHLFYFSRRTMEKILEKTGFKVLKLSCPWKLVPWKLILYQISPFLKSFLGPLGRLSAGIYINLYDVMFIIAQKE